MTVPTCESAKINPICVGWDTPGFQRRFLEKWLFAGCEHFSLFILTPISKPFQKHLFQLLFQQAGVQACMSTFMACAYENCEIDIRICQCEYTLSFVRSISGCILLLGVKIPCLYCLVIQISFPMTFFRCFSPSSSHHVCVLIPRHKRLVGLQD